MKKSFLSILAISAMMVSCGGNNTENKSEAQPVETSNVESVECVASGDVVFIDLDYVMAAEINQGILRHLDVLILPNSKINVAKDYITPEQLKDFMDAGNTVVATGKIATLAPEHKNLIKLPAKASVKKHIMNKH